MEPQSTERRLTTILSADVAGYSRLMGEDEAGTLAALKAHRQELIEPKAAQYRGRTVKLMGDGALMEFGSVVDAVLFAVEFQSAMAERNAGIAEDGRVDYRVGINIGDIIVEADDIYGDGVNVAARLEALAEPGGIYVAANVFDQVKNKLDLGFEHLGKKEVKNIAEPISIYRIMMDERASALRTPVVQAKAPTWRVPVIAAGAAILVMLVGGLLWLQPWGPDVEPASIERMALPLPDKPSIAVLPFANMTGDAGKDYLSDGITEDIITDLSKFPQLFVIARTSVFAYKDKPTTVQQVSEELGVRYVLEGSFREAGQKVRVTAQLIDATTGYHIWAERFDRDLTDLFALQDEITQSIVAAMAGELAQEELARAKRKDTANLESYDLYLRGRDLLDNLTQEDNAKARETFQRAIDLDKEYARGYAGMALTYFFPVQFKWTKSPAESLEKSFDYARKAVALDASDYYTHQTLGRIYIARKDYDQGLASYETALSLNPNDADLLASMGLPAFFSGRPEEAIGWVSKAMRLNPSYPSWYPLVLGCSYYVAKRYEEAVVPLTDSINRNPKALVTHSFLAASYGQLGREEEARGKVKEILRMKPDFSVAGWSKGFKFKDLADLEHYAEGLQKAGLPD